MADEVGNANQTRGKMGSIAEIICCPRCHSGLNRNATELLCTNADCEFAREGFVEISGQPVLIDFDASLLSRKGIMDRPGAPDRSSRRGVSLRTRVMRFVFGDNLSAERICAKFMAHLKVGVMHPRILVIGGGARGCGTEALYADDSIDVVGTDVYISPFTQILADGHQLPFIDESFDGVWIQAVLEHVLEPSVVVAEIHRVLKSGGLVYADTPFIHPVHEGAYDFTRFTLSGHRWLFRNFELLNAGVSGGTGTAFTWMVFHVVRMATSSGKLGMLLSLPFFWVRYLERLAKPRNNADAASGVYFYGCKSSTSIGPRDMVAFYESQQC